MTTKSLKYFIAAFEKWFRASGLKQYQAGMLFEMSQSHVTKLLRHESGISLEKADEIARILKTSLWKMLREGEAIVEGTALDGNTPLTAKQFEALEAFKIAIAQGGEGAELLIDNAFRLATKKKAEADVENPTPAKLAESA